MSPHHSKFRWLSHIADPAPQSLCATADDFGLEAPCLAGFGCFCRAPADGNMIGSIKNILQPGKRIGSVSRLIAEPAGGDENFIRVFHPALAGKCAGSGAGLIVQHGGTDKPEPQLHSTGHFVDILPARTADAHEHFADIVRIDFDRHCRTLDHFPIRLNGFPAHADRGKV